MTGLLCHRARAWTLQRRTTTCGAPGMCMWGARMVPPPSRLRRRSCPTSCLRRATTRPASTTPPQQHCAPTCTGSAWQVWGSPNGPFACMLPGWLMWHSAVVVAQHRTPLLSLPCAVSHAVFDACIGQTRLRDACALMHAGGGLPHMLPPRPAHRELEARGLLHSPPGFGAEGVDVRQSRGYAPPAVQQTPLQPPNRSAGFSAAAAARVPYSPFQAATEPPAPSYTAIPAPAHAISRLVEPDVEAQSSALRGSRLDGQVDYGTDADTTAASSHDDLTKLPALSDGLQAATSASELWQLDAQHSSFSVLEQLGDLEEDLPGGNQALPSAAEQWLPVMDSQDASWHCSGIEYAAEEGEAAAQAAQAVQAVQEPPRQQVSSVWGNPLATVRMPQGAPVHRLSTPPFLGNTLLRRSPNP